jgi:hypothetical protein
VYRYTEERRLDSLLLGRARDADMSHTNLRTGAPRRFLGRAILDDVY